MNDKFFELKKEKQDRMINGALRVFAENGYKRASTDDMVKVAGVSKGLWFHYFGNKLGLYEFMCEYAVRYFCMELTTVVDTKERNYYEVVRQMLGGMDRIMKAYPYLPLFLYRLSIENDMEAAEITMLGREKIQNKLNTSLKNVEFEHAHEKKEKDTLRKIVFFTLQGILLEWYHKNELETDKMIRDMKAYLQQFRELVMPTDTVVENSDMIETVAS